MDSKVLQKGRKIFSVIYNLIIRSAAHGISSVVNQLIYLPILGRIFDSVTYGLILTVISFINCIKDVLGSSLNNVRLVLNSKYEEKEISGDFNFLLMILLAIGSIALLIFFFIFPEIGLVQLLILLPALWLLILNSYLAVWYYIILDIKKTLINSIINGIGIIAGLLLVKMTDLWPLANLLAAILSAIYLINSTPILKESFQRTVLFKEVVSKLILVCGSSLLSSLLVYLDKLILYPIIGGEAVSIYSVAVFFGKTLNICVIPASGVLLGYLAQKNFCMNIKKMISINLATLLLFGIFIIGVIFVSPVFTELFYPTLYSKAQPYLLIGNFAAALGSISYVTQAIALKYADTKWIFIIQLIYCTVYITLGIFLLNRNGLYGFCVNMLVANSVKLFLLYIICGVYVYKLEKGVS